MTTITAEQVEQEAARNWCAGILAGAGGRIEGNVAKRYVDIGVEVLLSIYEDDEMSDDERVRRCDEIYAAAEASSSSLATICVVDGEEYRTCRDCPLRVG